ncbi:iron-sulfur cluster assembly scaffold protein NifU [Arcobacter sp. 31_11_sub10_T18]|nr:iron-sulfur cluster assembly scaffold protein NifU [Arcobacter sp. 31_11_sub10_T18]
MAKNNLISGSIWDEYSNQVVRRMDDPLHQGEITEEQADSLGAKLVVADFGAESCGDAVRLYWAVNEDTNEILSSKFKSFGCGTAIASSDVMAELCIGKKVEDAVKITNIDVELALRDDPDTPAVPPQKMHCSVMAYDVIKKAAASYMNVDMESFEAEIMVCECARVSLSTIQEVIKINDLTTVAQITDYTKAGAFCKSCIKPGGHEDREYYLVDILAQTRTEIEEQKMRDAADLSANDELTFDKMTMIQKLKHIEGVLDVDVRPMLIMDGGNMEIIDIKENMPHYDLYIRYLGACSGCASGSTGTLYGIESILQQKIDENIRVLPI